MELNPRTELPPRSACQEILPSLAPIRSVSPDWRAYNATTPLPTTVKVAKPPTIYALPRSIPTRISTLLLQTATDVPRRNRQHLQQIGGGLGQSRTMVNLRIIHGETRFMLSNVLTMHFVGRGFPIASSLPIESKSLCQSVYISSFGSTSWVE